MHTLYQAEWCPYSSAVREAMTEVGLPFVARQVPPWPEQRADLLERTGTDQIPVLETQNGELYRGAKEIIAYLRTLEPWEHAAGHRQRHIEHTR